MDPAVPLGALGYLGRASLNPSSMTRFSLLAIGVALTWNVDLSAQQTLTNKEIWYTQTFATEGVGGRLLMFEE